VGNGIITMFVWLEMLIRQIICLRNRVWRQTI